MSFKRLAVENLEPRQLLAITTYDIHLGEGSSTPSIDPAFSQIGNKLYFSASDGTTGRELHEFDLATNQVRMVADLSSGPTSSGPSGRFVVLDDKLYFTAYQPGFGFELHVYNPASDQVSIAADAMPGPVTSAINDMIAVGNVIYFSAISPGFGKELMKYDVSTEELSLVADIESGPGSSTPINTTLHEGKLYFSAETDALGRELYVYDPMADEVSLVADIQAGSGSSDPGRLGFGAAGGKLYFGATTDTFGEELYEYDPASSSVRMVANARVRQESSTPGISVGYFSRDDKLYFGADGRFGSGLYQFDPTTDLILPIVGLGLPGATGGLSQLAFVGDQVYISGYSFETGYELFSVDLANRQATLVADLTDGRPGSLTSQSDMVSANGKLYFSSQASDAVGHELRMYDPATDTFSLVDDYHVGSDDSFFRVASESIIAGRLFSTAENSTFGRELVTLSVPISPDFNHDGELNCHDIDQLTSNIASGRYDGEFDLNADGWLDTSDRDEWLKQAGASLLDTQAPFLPSDANLDGSVDVSDFNIWNENRFTTNSAWCSGDFNTDGVIDVEDFNLWNAYKFTASGQPNLARQNSGLNQHTPMLESYDPLSSANVIDVTIAAWKSSDTAPRKKPASANAVRNVMWSLLEEEEAANTELGGGDFAQ
ncbi:MAG: hypothetical protein AAF497_01415 [Planctomycetota bacterium]